MKDKIKSLLQQAWSSTISGVDIDKATSKLYLAATEMLADERAKLVGHYTKLMFQKDELVDSFEVDMELSNNLLVEVLPELESFKAVHSNNPNKSTALNNLIFRIEEQIIKNGQ